MNVNAFLKTDTLLHGIFAIHLFREFRDLKRVAKLKSRELCVTNIT